MRILPLLILCLLALQSCSLQERLNSVSSNLEQEYANLKTWQQLPERTISWNQAIAMMKRNNSDYIKAQNAIEKSQRNELSVYTDLIPGVSFYSYFTRSIGDMAKKLDGDEVSNNINVTFNLPSLTQVSYRVYAAKAGTFAAIKTLEGKERELVSQLYSLQRRQQINAKKAELEKKKPDTKEDYRLKKDDSEIGDWMKLAKLLGDYSARWKILPSSVPHFSWKNYRKLTETMDELVVCKFALDLEQARMRQYSIALTYLPTINLSLYSPSLFSSTGGTYSGTFLDTDDTKLNMSVNYSLDTQLRTWNSYRDSKESYELKKRETTAALLDLKQKLLTLRTSMDEYYAWRSFMNKRMDYLRTAPTTNAAEFIDNKNTLQAMQEELINQEATAIESEAALILQYGLR